MVELHGSSGAEQRHEGAEPVADAAALSNALNSATAGTTIRLKANMEYKVNKTLVVPDGVRLQGAGEMHFDKGFPTGFKMGTASTITAKPNLVGNLVTLGK
jgi:hypothetical protein